MGAVQFLVLVFSFLFSFLFSVLFSLVLFLVLCVVFVFPFLFFRSFVLCLFVLFRFLLFFFCLFCFVFSFLLAFVYVVLPPLPVWCAFFLFLSLSVPCFSRVGARFFSPFSPSLLFIFSPVLRLAFLGGSSHI